MKVMISQPMRGKEEEIIIKERESLIKEITALGYEYVDTIVATKAPEDMDTAIYYLSKSIEWIGKVDAVIFMKGWEKARGCKIEHAVAVEYGKQVFYCNE